MDWRRAVRGVGRTLVTAGVLILLFVAYQLWGTGLAEARSQDRLRESFEARVAPATGGAPTTTPPTEGPPPPPPGDAVAIIRIPRLGVEKTVIEGVNLVDLKKGPGHYPGTPMPGQPGNSAIAGHRTTYGAPFFRLDELARGDRIMVTTAQGAFEYRVRETRIVSPREVSVLDPTPDNRLTLTTCHPRFSAAQRMVVVSELVGPAAPPSPPPDPPPPPGARSFDEAGLSGQGAAAWPTVWWGLLAAAVWVAAWLAGRRWRRWPAYLAGAPVFFVVLFVFFENVSRLLPANY